MAAPDTFTVSPLVLARLGLPSLERLCERAGVAPAGALRTSEFRLDAPFVTAEGGHRRRRQEHGQEGRGEEVSGGLPLALSLTAR